MKTRLLLLIALVFGLASELTWAQQERKLVIEPGLPDSDDLITISVTDSECYNFSSVLTPKSAEDNSIQITLQYLSGTNLECWQDPDAPNFETTIGPLSPRKYQVALYINGGGLGSHLTDTKSFSVIEAYPASGLSEGGITGLYHRPDSPHQYFYVLETVYNTLLVWNTFDADGNQLWVYGVGDLYNEGQSVVTDAYINRSIGFLPSGEPEIEAEPWGSIRLDMTSCTEGVVTYESDLPEFESGQFPIVRLAYSKQIGCIEQP